MIDATESPICIHARPPVRPPSSFNSARTYTTLTYLLSWPPPYSFANLLTPRARHTPHAMSACLRKLPPRSHIVQSCTLWSLFVCLLIIEPSLFFDSAIALHAALSHTCE